MSVSDPTLEAVVPVAEDIDRLCWKHRWMARVGFLRVTVVHVEGMGRMTMASRDRRGGETTVVCAG